MKGLVALVRGLFFGKSAKAHNPDRLWELDALRGVFILQMIAYHLIFTANFIGLSSLSPYDGFIGLWPIFIAGGFLLLAGLSDGLEGQLRLERGLDRSWSQSLRRFARVGIPALVISLVTLVAVRLESFVGFGVLHCVAVSALLCQPFRRRPLLALIPAGLFLAGGFYLFHGKGFPSWAWFLMPLGLRPETYYPIDYVPILPWSGFCLLGFGLSPWLFSRGRRRYPSLGSDRLAPWFRPLSFLGRHSLFVYLVHIPAIFCLLYPLKIILIHRP